MKNTNETKTETYLDDSYEKGCLNALMGKNIYIFLGSGIKLMGKLLGYDDIVISIKKDNSAQQLIYKNLISTIEPIL